MIIRLYDRVRLSIYSTSALFHKYFVGMKYRQICKFLILSAPLTNSNLMHLVSLGTI